jgi:cell division protease FtsH
MAQKTPMQPKGRVNTWYIMLAVLGVLLLQYFYAQSQQVEAIPYSTFEKLLNEGQIKSVAITDRQIVGEFKAPQDGKTRFTTTRVDQELAAKLAEKGVEFRGVVESTLFRDILSWIIPIGLFFGLWWFVIRRMGQGGVGGFMSIGKSRAKIYVETDTKVTFADVAGVDEAKDELREIVEFLKKQEDYGRLGARIPKGILLVGPPGTGKTLLARAVAGEAGVKFYSISGSEFVEMFVGVGAARVRDLFETARKDAPAIIFIDELDALGRARGMSGMVGGHDEREQTLNQLLAELDGFDPSTGVVLLAATNRPEVLDPALLRAGRFDRQVLVDRPDKRGRVQILNVHIKKIKLAPDVDLEKVAALTTGFTGADLANLVNEAALMATRRRAGEVAMEDFTAGIERIIAGLEKRSRVMNPREREVVAYHEMGHAITALALPGTDEVHKVSIIPRGIGALGYTIQRPTDDRYILTRAELENRIAVLLGGRAAEKLVFDHLSTGAADDLAKVTDIARSMVMRFGMDERLGHVSYDAGGHGFLGQQGTQTYLERRYSEETAKHIDAAVKHIVDETFARVLGILADNRAVLETCARTLLQKETLNEDELRDLTRDLKHAAPQAMRRAAE